ncbi:MAG: pyridoxamine 5'-phosphate oxidase family protein [Candidatus Thorarchaeota archaeon]|jgi:general stress protein 26
MEDKEMAIYLLEHAKAAFLTSIDADGFPQTRGMFNLRNKDSWPRLIPLFEKHTEDFMVLFTTNTSSSKIEDIKRNQRVSVYYSIPDESRGLMIGGTIEIVDDDEIKKKLWHEGWEKYYPKGYNDPDHTVLRLYPIVGRGWNQNHTYRFEIGVEK